MAFAVIYKATRVVNFALGEVMMLTAYIAFSIQDHLSLSFIQLVCVTILARAGRRDDRVSRHQADAGSRCSQS